MGDRSDPHGGAAPVDAGLDSSQSQPPPPPPDSSIPPPPTDTPQFVLSRRSRETRARAAALFLPLAGWGIWLYGWLAEIDTGYPDGLACTINPIDSPEYASCMSSNERSGAIAWGLTLGLAMMALIMLPRTRRASGPALWDRLATVSAFVTSALLAVAGVWVWSLGAQGELFEGRIGATTWHSAMIIWAAVGLAAGWFFTRRREAS